MCVFPIARCVENIHPSREVSPNLPHLGLSKALPPQRPEVSLERVLIRRYHAKFF